MPFLKSHPDQELKDHLLGVWQLARQLWGDRKILPWDSKLLGDLLAIVTLTHDFAKATRYFQNYITSPELGQKKSGPLESHALLSAIVGYFMAKTYLKDHPDNKRLSYMVFLAIKRHHGNLRDITDECAVFGDKEQELLLKQVEAIDFSLLKETWQSIDPQLPLTTSFGSILTQELLKEWVYTFKDELRQVRRAWLRSGSNDFLLEVDQLRVPNTTHQQSQLQDYFRFLILYSLLLDADKCQVGVRDYRLHIVKLPADLVDTFKNKQDWEIQGLNALREEAYQEIAGNLDLADKGNIFSITLPTGLGKTLAAYNFAFKLREKRLQERGTAPKIIYTLPFLTVIDQNYQILSDILENQTGHHILIKHHHLTDPVYNMRTGHEDETSYSANAAKLLIEGWSSEIVVTTFVQLFETLIGWRNSTLRKFHRLAHAIIILDEIQALPIKYWPLAQQMLEFLAGQMNTDIILVTATQPKIFSGLSKVIELVQPQKYFSQMGRVRLEINVNRRTIDEFVEDELREQLSANPEKSFLFILNTVSSAKELYRQLKNLTSEPIAFLSTGVVMKERKKRIEDIRDKKYRLVVSTQLVEAGVDIDFDIVYRDLAPMDSINQAAGRCNRHGLGNGIVRIISLVASDRGRSYAHMIYDDVALDITKKILENYKEVDEKEFLNLIDLYFTQAKSKMLLNESHKILQAVQRLCFFAEDETKTSVSDFQLIKEKGHRENVFVELDKEAEEVWAEYERIIQINGFYEKQEKFNAIKKIFYEYVISIPVSRLTDLPPEVNHFRYVCSSQIEYYYDRNLGYDSKGATIIF
ncbi:CRISPR-associated helicase, Cas3 family [Desulforamulus putei DSM 12395]|uniref:CRISPR-associated helicase, Cas3 family n=1 Tax=Desulforamulus putei DSM 12395 TaxID=1121429 RepID=A0A1M5AIG6_9FIRM|nr:CRISPR-associated helicase/endonuclease Cas3 [Desulforamulus putei]SHF29692.1 CRISPR-associated helicase, Cas3 family [Desulforamulus putei DSM 12395]